MKRPRGTTIKSSIDLLASIGMVVAAALIIWNSLVPRQDTPPVVAAVQNMEAAALTTTLSGLSVMGSVGAPIAIIEFADYECPFCRRFVDGTLEQIDLDFVQTGKIRYAFRNFPLERIHKQALRASHVAECAAVQGQFWPMHKRLFARQSDFGEQLWVAEATALNLDSAAFEDCLAASAPQKIRADMAEGARLGVVSTPTFLIGRVVGDDVDLVTMISGAQPYAVFHEALTNLLSPQ